ncbi:MAG: DUF6702 family protein [Ferruginibacter sp.]
MRSIFYKWLFLAGIWLLTSSLVIHPFYLSVTEIEHNAKDKTLEISCKIFTDDFEKALRAAYKTHVDLLNPAQKTAMDLLVSNYVKKHLAINVNGKLQELQYKGYEQIEEGIYSYYQVDNIPTVKSITVTDNILYEYQAQQVSLLHITVGGKRQSNRMVNPEEKYSVSY